MKKRIGSLFLVLALCLSLMPMTVLAEETAAMPTYSGGSGTKDNPWLISSVEDLQLLASTIREGIHGNYHGYYFKQTKDLDLSSIENWEPIGYSLDEGCYFAGQYDGDGHTISNATSTGKNDDEGYATAGIFGWVLLGSVENLRVDRANFTATGVSNGGWGGYSYAGGIAAGAFVATIKNCTVTNSDITSKRLDKDGNADQNNCAGGVVGYSAGAQFVNCASISNQITSQCYGGGFVGENDDDNEIEEGTLIDPSTYTNCFVANCSVNATTPDSQGTSFAGGFIGRLGDQNLALTNCYAYNTCLSTEGTSACIADTGVFVGNFYTNGGTYTASINTTNCYYGECGITNNVGTATEKTAEEFTNGAVAKALGDVFAQGKHYPVFATDPADYTAVDAAIAKANTLNKSDYTDFTAVESAVNAVVRDKKIAEQSAVDAMAKAIEDAIKALVEKPTSGDYYEPTYPITTPNKTENGTVTVSPKNATSGSTVTVTVTPNSGYTLETLTVTDKNGKELKLTDKGDGKYTFTMPSGKVDIKATFMEDNSLLNFFYDVPNDAYCFDAVKWAVKNGITAGVGDNLFAPNQPCTRAEIVTFLWRAAGSPVVNYAMNMSDIPEGAYYAEAVRWALSEGIAVGTSADTFSPDDTCTRAEAVTFLCRAKGSKMDYNNEFTDVGGDDYYADAVAWAEKNNVTVGVGNDKFAPDDDCSRGQIVTFLYRTYQN